MLLFWLFDKLFINMGNFFCSRKYIFVFCQTSRVVKMYCVVLPIRSFLCPFLVFIARFINMGNKICSRKYIFVFCQTSRVVKMYCVVLPIRSFLCPFLVFIASKFRVSFDKNISIRTNWNQLLRTVMIIWF